MRVSTQQYSFAAGELSPRLYGRTDLQKYESGAELIENFIVRPEGGLMRRHGTRFAGETRDSRGRSRLIPFVFSTVQAYMLEFGPGTIRVWKDAAPVVSVSKPVITVTSANPARVTAFAHGFANGDRVLVTGLKGMGELNNREFTIANADADGFELSGIDSTSFTPYRSGGTVSKIYEIASPYAEAELETIAFAQSADVLYLVHAAHAPRTLTRTGHAAWTLAAVPLDRGPFAAMNGNDTLRVMCAGASGFQPGAQVTLKASAPLFTMAHEGSHFRMQEIYLADQNVSPWSPGEGITTTIGTQVSSNGHVYALTDAGSGAQTGTVAPSHTEGDAWDNPVGATHRKKWRYLHSRWAILRLDSFVDSKTMQATAVTYLCNGLAPPAKSITNVTNAGGFCRVTAAGHGYDEGDYVAVSGVGGAVQANGDWRIINVSPTTFDLANSNSPALYTAGGSIRRYATWLWAESAFSAARGFPAAVALHEQRLVFANTKAQPFGLWASASADYANFLPGTRDDETISYNIAANQADPIRWLTSASDLLVGTLSQEFAAFGGGLGDPITPANTRIVPQSGEGSNAVQPVKVGIETIFVNRAGRKIFSLANQADVGAYVSTDLTELAEHLTRNAAVTRLAWAKNPASLLWALRTDGKLLSMTYRREQQLYAWAQHDFGGEVESIAVIPSADGATDDLWLIVRRTINATTRRFVEILAPPFEPVHETDKVAMGFVDCALSYQGAPTTAMSGLSHLEGEGVTVVADGALHPTRVVGGGGITLERKASNAWIGLGYQSSLRTLRLEAATLGLAQGRTKRIPRFAVRVLNAIGGEAQTGTGGVAEELVRRDLGDAMDASPPLRSGSVDVFPASDFDQDARITIRQREPMPLDILSIAPVLSMAD
ncbi:MAG: ubiquitin-activating E1 FCCH domain-containing protein [Micropepsaceae bacterium]